MMATEGREDGENNVFRGTRRACVRDNTAAADCVNKMKFSLTRFPGTLNIVYRSRSTYRSSLVELVIKT